MRFIDQSCLVVSAPTSDALLNEINTQVTEFAQTYPDAHIQSISHDVMIQATGAFLWTAMLTINRGTTDAESETANQG